MKELPTKGFILPDKSILELDSNTCDLSHEGIAFRYIRDHGLFKTYRNSEHSSAQDFLVFELNAMQINSAGKMNLILLRKNYSIYEEYIDEYQLSDSRWSALLLSGR